MNARLGVWLPLHQRRSERLPTWLAAAIGVADARGIEVIVRDLAPHGFAVDLAHALPTGTMVWLMLPGTNGLNARVARRDGRRHGCEFLVPIAAELCDSAAVAQQAAA